MTALPPPEVLESGGIDPGSLNALPWDEPVWLVDLGSERVVLSVKGGRTDAILDWEAALLDALEERSFPSSRSIKIFDGADHIAVEGRHYVARSFIPGRTLVELEPPDLALVGRFIAELHRVTEDIDLPQRPGIGSLVEVLREPTDEQLAAGLAGNDAAARYRTFVDDVEPSITRSVGASLPIHGDFTTRNIVADGDPPFITGLIDFGMAMIASPVVELAYALGSTRPDFGAVEHLEDRVTTLIASYAELRALEEGAAEHIVDNARARPLLNIALRTRSGRLPRSSRALERVGWLTDHRGRMIAAVEQGLSAPGLSASGRR